MSKLAHSCDKTMAEIERDAQDGRPTEPSTAGHLSTCAVHQYDACTCGASGRTELEARAEGHTPTPYTYHRVNTSLGWLDWIEDANGNRVVENVGCHDGPFIVQACNSFDAMKAALETARNLISDQYASIGGSTWTLRQIDAALALSRGEQVCGADPVKSGQQSVEQGGADGRMLPVSGAPSNPDKGAAEKWQLASANDALYIINDRPHDNDYAWHDRPDGPSVALLVHGLSDDRAQLICDAHNSAIAALAAERDALKEECERLRDSLKPFADFPLRGIHGGPLCAVKGLYEDGTDENIARHRGSLSPEVFERARAALTKKAEA